MSNIIDSIPSYVKETDKFSKFLSLVGSFIYSGAIEISKMKESFLSGNRNAYVIRQLSKLFNVVVDVPIVNGNIDYVAYHDRLNNAVRSKSFVAGFKGDIKSFDNGDVLNDLLSMTVMDFSVAKDDKVPMSVVYSCISNDDNLTLNIVREYLIPRVTGVGSNLYYLQYGKDLFGYDKDDREGKAVGEDHVTIEDVGVDDSKGYFIRGFDDGYFVPILKV